MAIKKSNSKQLMDIMQQSEDKIKKLSSDVASMRLTLDKRLQVMKNIQEYILLNQSNLKETVSKGILKDVNNRIVFAQSNIVDGKYELFGTTIQPQFLKRPTNVFNFETSTGATFKDNCSVTMNAVSDPDYRAMLMHDSIPDQAMAFNEFDVPVVELDIKINPEQLLGATSFNTIEIVPYLPGSFDILSIEIYSMQDHMLKNTNPSSQINTQLMSMGDCRIMTDRRYNLYECKIRFRVNYRNSSGKYPFGLKHIYFLDAEYNPESYVIVKQTQNKFLSMIDDDITVKNTGKFINFVSDKIKVIDQTGEISTTCKDENIKLYMDYEEGALAYPINTSKGVERNELTRDIKSMYVYVPLVRSTISMTFDKIELR